MMMMIIISVDTNATMAADDGLLIAITKREREEASLMKTVRCCELLMLMTGINNRQ